jgi:C4-dicarboxylate-specific signal transduction histidine kinase
VVGDRVCLQQVLANLIINAMEAMAGELQAVRQIVVKGFNGDAQVGLTVTDSSPGVPPEVLPKLFDSFFTTKDGGMGLGLSVARSLVQAHGGRIWADNNEQGGATFGFVLPLPEAALGVEVTARNPVEYTA